MTTSTTNLNQNGFFARLWAGLVEGFERQAYAASRRDLIEALEARSDEELAQMGLKRDQIARYVFQDLFYA